MQTRTTWVGPHTLAGGRGPPLMIAPPPPSPAVSDEGVLGSAIPPAGTQYASAEEQQCALAQLTQKSELPLTLKALLSRWQACYRDVQILGG